MTGQAAYILIRHDPTEDNRKHLYECSRVALVVMLATSTYREAIDIVEVRIPDDTQGKEYGDLEYLAQDQLTLFQGGLEARSALVFRDLEAAQAEALAVLVAMQAFQPGTPLEA